MHYSVLHASASRFGVIFALGAAAFLSTPSYAITLNSRGLGHVLLYPYYTVNKAQQTLITIGNSADTGKVIKVRFLEGMNGRTVLDFNVFLRGGDMWAGAIGRDPNGGGAAMITTDKSCLPGITSWPVRFSTTSFSAGTGPGSVNQSDGGPTTSARTLEGRLEVYALGDVIPNSPTDRALSAEPMRCADLTELSFISDIVAPTPTLFGSAAIVDVGNGMFYGYAPDALSEFTARVLATNTAQTGVPNLGSANSAGSTDVKATIFDNDGKPLELRFERGVDAVSAALTATHLFNEYMISPGLGAKTDWIVTFPTKAYYVDKQLYPSTITRPFYEAFASPGKSFVTAQRKTWVDREGHELTRLMSGIPSPEERDAIFGANMAYEVNAIPFCPHACAANEASPVLGSTLRATSPIEMDGLWPSPTEAGWMKISFMDADAPHPNALTARMINGTAVTLNGLPVSGFMVYNIINDHARPGMLANYGGTFRHNRVLSCYRQSSQGMGEIGCRSP